jgi:hypothetical protein
MIKLIAVASFALLLATSAQAMTPAPVPQTDNDMITQIAAATGPGRTRVNGVCVAHYPPDAPRAVRRCARWQADVCALYE